MGQQQTISTPLSNSNEFSQGSTEWNGDELTISSEATTELESQQLEVSDSDHSNTSNNSTKIQQKTKCKRQKASTRKSALRLSSSTKVTKAKSPPKNKTKIKNNGKDFTRITRAKQINMNENLNNDGSINEHNNSSNWLNLMDCIQVGPSFQAEVPERLNVLNVSNVLNVLNCEGTKSKQYRKIEPETIPHRNDTLLWDPKVCPEKKVRCYLKKVAKIFTSNGNSRYELEDVADNEQALYHLMQCGGDVKKAASGRKLLNSFLANNNLQHMSSLDCIRFEQGMLHYYKDFEKIRDKFLPEKRVDQLIEYFYYWKKTPRYEELKMYKIRPKKDYTMSQSVFMKNTVEKLNLPYRQNNDGSYSVINSPQDALKQENNPQS